MTNIDNVFEIESLDESQNSFVKEKTPETVDGLKKWLNEFKMTHYPKRPLTDQFWVILNRSVHVGIDVVQLLGSEVKEYVRDYNPKYYKQIVK